MIPLSLTQVLALLGYDHRRVAPGSYRHDVVDAEGGIVMTGDAHTVWAWVRQRLAEPDLDPDDAICVGCWGALDADGFCSTPGCDGGCDAE